MADGRHRDTVAGVMSPRGCTLKSIDESLSQLCRCVRRAYWSENDKTIVLHLRNPASEGVVGAWLSSSSADSIDYN